jgi:hypothetical protein
MRESRSPVTGLDRTILDVLTDRGPIGQRELGERLAIDHAEDGLLAGLGGRQRDELRGLLIALRDTSQTTPTTAATRRRDLGLRPGPASAGGRSPRQPALPARYLIES